MFQIEAARRNPINQERKEAFNRGENVNLDRPVGFGGEHPALGGGAAKIAMLNREKIEGKEVKSQLQKLDGRRGNPGEPLDRQELGQARMPFMGAEAGAGAPRARFVKGEDRNLTTDQIYEKYGPVNGQIANDVIRRFRAAQGTQPDGFAAPKADPIVAQKAAPNQAPLAGISYNETAPDPWSAQPATGGGFTQNNEKRMPAQMLNALAELNSGPTQGPRTPGIRQKIMNSIKRAPINFRTAPKAQRYGAVAGGALTGLVGIDGLIGGESERRQEEQY
jgi:hypothetical protein